MRISYSALETFLNCPAKFKFQEIDKIKVPKSKEAIFGTLVHKTLHMLHEPTRLTPPTQEEVLQYFTQNWDSSVYEDRQEEMIAFSQGIKLLKDYYIQNHPSKFNIVDLETRFEAPIIEKSKNRDIEEVHQITGKIDRIDRHEDGTFEVIDYKTARKMPSQEHVDTCLQLAVYYLGLTNRWPSLSESEESKPVKLSLFFLKHGMKLSTQKTAEVLDETKERILTIIDKIDNSLSNNKFEPRPNPLCDWCGYKPYCPLFRHQFLKEKQDFSDEEIKSLANEYFQLKENVDKESQRMAEIKEKINEYCEAKGFERVFADSGYITRISQKRFAYDASKLRAILEPLGKWEEVLVLDSQKLKRVVEELPWEIRKQVEEAKILEREFKTILATPAGKKISQESEEKPKEN